MHLKPVIDDLWNIRHALMSDFADGHPLTRGPRKSRDDMMIDIEIANTFKAVCFLCGVKFEYKERSQAIRAMAVCIKQGSGNNPAIWVDGIKIAACNFDTHEVELCDESMMEIADMTRQEIMRATKVLAVKRVERMKASRTGGH